MHRRERKTAVITLRLQPALKAAAERAADRDQRSLTNFIEVLIIDRCRALEIEVRSDPRGEAGEG